jgi:hypothetical protein
MGDAAQCAAYGMSVTEGAESAELLRCARSLHRPVLPVLRFGDSLPRHLEAPLRLQPTGPARSIRAAGSAGAGAGTGAGTGTGGGTAPAGSMRQVSKNGLFEPFIYKNEHFTKTGSGQTQGKLQQKDRFSSGASALES